MDAWHSDVRIRERSSSDLLGSELGRQSVTACHQQRGEAGLEIGFGGVEKHKWPGEGWASCELQGK